MTAVYSELMNSPTNETLGIQMRLDHINLPAQKPEWLADWYAETFNLRAKDGFVLGAGVVIVFEKGDPLTYDGNAQFGFRCDSKHQVLEWAEKLAVSVEDEAIYCAFTATDPEGYVFDVYWEAPAG